MNGRRCDCLLEDKMGSNFKIHVHRRGDRLRLKLAGDLDGESAWQIINLLEENSSGIKKVAIDTNGLTRIYLFGRNMFSKNFYRINKLYSSIIFTGGKSNQMTPEKKLSL